MAYMTHLNNAYTGGRPREKRNLRPGVGRPTLRVPPRVFYGAAQGADRPAPALTQAPIQPMQLPLARPPAQTTVPPMMQAASLWGRPGEQPPGTPTPTPPTYPSGPAPVTSSAYQGAPQSATTAPSSWDQLMQGQGAKWELGDRTFAEMLGSWYGMPLIDSMLRQMGFELVNGQWVQTRREDYDVGAVNRTMTGVRDQMEPELLRMISAGQHNLAGRGMDLSSVGPAVESGLRGDYLSQMISTRSDLIQQERMRRWQQLLQVLAGAQQQAGVAASSAMPQDQGGGWGDIFGSLLPFAASFFAPSAPKA